MNRAFLFILIPALLVFLAYVFITRHMGVHLIYAPFLGAAGAFLGGIAAVYLYRRRKARRRTF